MIENRWLVELAANNFTNNSAMFRNRFLEDWDNASSWLGWIYEEKTYFQDTHIYTWKQIRERVMALVKRDEERRKKRQEQEENNEW